MKYQTDDPAERDAIAAQRRANRMKMIDDMSPEMRALVHEYGLNIVKNMIDLGVRKPKHIRHLVETILDEMSPTRGTSSQQGKGSIEGWTRNSKGFKE